MRWLIEPIAGGDQVDAQRPAGTGVPREAAVRRLLELDDAGRLRTQDLELVAAGQSVSTRTVRRWLEVARAAGTPAASSGRRERRDRFVVTAQVRERFAFWRGNVAALYRAIQRDVLPGDRAWPAPW